MWKNWFQEQWRPKKKAPSLEQLKYHYIVLTRTSQVTESNRPLVVETFRSIAEILIWGDQNDNSVFDFFLEKNMQSFFLRILSQRCGKFVCVQLLQTLNILYENIKNETSLYYLLSNNHINSIIVHKFDFSDEEILAYYISFLKTLSFKLNIHTIHFFYNEHLRDFPLYTEAIKFFNHHESMVRIAVRTLTLNVYKVNDHAMLEYIRNKTAAPYFSNLVWFIGSHVIELDECIRCQANHLNRSRLEHLVAEHLDDMHYLNDILSLGIDSLNDVLISHTLGRLLLPLYVHSLMIDQPIDKEDKKPCISSTVALFLLSQVFLIIQSSSLVTRLAHVILTGHLPQESSASDSHAFLPPDVNLETKFRQPPAKGYIPAQRTMPVQKRLIKPIDIQVGVDGKEEYLLIDVVQPNKSVVDQEESHDPEQGSHNAQEESHDPEQGSHDTLEESHDTLEVSHDTLEVSHDPEQGSHDTQEKSHDPEQGSHDIQGESHDPVQELHNLQDGTIQEGSHDTQLDKDRLLSAKEEVVAMEAIIDNLHVSNDDRSCLFAICLLDGIISNNGVDCTLLREHRLLASEDYHHTLVTKLLGILVTSTASDNYVRLVTMAMCMKLLQQILDFSKEVILMDEHLAQLENLLESTKLFLRLHYQGANDEIFLESFEDEYWMHQRSALKPSLILMDVAVLLLPTETPLTGIEFTRRLPCGKHEKTRRALRVFFAIRQLYHKLTKSVDHVMPLTPPTNSASCGDLVDLNNYDMLPCTVTIGHRSTRRFLVLTDVEVLLVEPGRHHLGCGVVNFIGFLQHTEIEIDPADSCAIYMTVHHASGKKLPALSAHCRFDDHIRCVAAKKNISHKKESLRLAKMACISDMLDLPTQPTGPSHPKGLQYSKLTIVDDNVPHAPVKGSRAPMTSQGHVITSPLVKEEAIQLASKNDDGSVMLPMGVEMDTLGFSATPQSPEQRHLSMLITSNFSHEEHHLDQRSTSFSQRQLGIDQQQQQQENHLDQQQQNGNSSQEQSSIDQQKQLSNDQGMRTDDQRGQISNQTTQPH